MPKLTPAQQLLLQAVLSMLWAALIAALIAVEQVNRTGHFDLAVCINVALVTVGAVFGKALYSYVPAHISTELQALRDTMAEIQARQHATVPLPPETLHP